MNVSDKPNTLRAQMKHHEPIVCMAIKTKQIDMRTADETAHPLDGNDDKEPQAVCFAWANSGDAGLSAAESAPTVKANRNGNPAVCYSADLRNGVLNREIIGTLQAHNMGGGA